MKYKNQVLKILKETRKWAEEIAFRKKGPSDLTGMCAIASRRILTELIKVGLNAEIAVSEDENDHSRMHAFVIYDGHILDVTASQFGKKKICVMKATEKNLQDWWKPKDKFFSGSGLIKYQHSIDWCTDEVTVHGKCNCGHKDNLELR